MSCSTKIKSLNTFSACLVISAQLHPLNHNFLFLEYLAVEQSCRNQGIGKLSLNKVIDICRQSNKHLIFEVTNPDFSIESEREKIIKKLKFYKKLGAKEMKDVRYIMPPLQLDIPANEKLMIMEYPENQMSGKLVESLIRQFYKDVYSRSEDDSFLNSFIHDIPPLVELI